MDSNKTKPENEFSFIQEKVRPRRKHRVKKIAMSSIITIFLAVIFGLVARIVFVTSEGWINRLLSIDTTKRSEILFPSEFPDEKNSKDPLDDTKPTPDGNILTELTPTVFPTPILSLTPTKVPESEKIKVVEQKIPADVSDYESILLDIKKLANSVNNCLVTVTGIESKKDWLEEQYESRKSTTGIIVGENNAELMILTDWNKVSTANEIEVSFSGGFVVEGELWNYDKDYNLAIIAIKLKDIPPLQLSSIKTANIGESYSLTVGSAVLALGQPNGLNGSMEIGMITSKGSSYYLLDNRLDLFTTDIIHVDNSGGVIVNMQGKIIGLISQEVNKNNLITTAIGISRIMPIVEKLVNRFDRVLFGIYGEDIPGDVLKDYQLEHGIYVAKVLQDSPAYHADVRQGDIIVGINEYSISSITNLASVLSNFKTEDNIAVTIMRMSKSELKEIKVEVTLDKKE